MKKTSIAILAFLYLIIASGVVVNYHYCMGDLSSIQYGISGDEACSKCGMKEKKGCCQTDYKLVKLQDAHQVSKSLVTFSQYEAELPAFAEQQAPLIEELSQLSLRYLSPPDPRGNSVYLHNSIFRI